MGGVKDKPDAKPVPPELPPESPSDRIVERWFLDHFHNVPAFSHEAFNRARAAADDLKARLRAKES